MTHVLLLGATGRTGAAILRALPAKVKVTAAVRAPEDAVRLSETQAFLECATVDVADVESIRRAMAGASVVINAIRLREDIEPTELVDLHSRVVAAGTQETVILTVGGAGSLRLPGGQRFWQTPAFPQATLPRGRAHTALRDHLENEHADRSWAYLIPPPLYDPAGPHTSRWESLPPGEDETAFTTRSISYADFGEAAATVAMSGWTGTHLIAWSQG